ncbi:MAG: hypothetical protein UY03_C0007G0036 [Parcubacteria group bacterium GW2011_GWA2_47_64]|nr:MAG: hypothetical protein UY03_C0007G0036 [Parcubacteria group bacterium GW2011_GWA2_47_64]KKU96349.1 MAG: hypothetical protein UY29_C0013G0001 [Parcubacteria group bacterium GW2011_GWC2_48_17]
MKRQGKKKQVSYLTFDTKIDTIQKKYGVDLDVDPDKRLGEFLRERGYPSLAKMLQEA